MINKTALLLSAASVVAVLSAPIEASAQSYDAEIRVQQLEQRLRTLTGQNEELQFRNRQLEEQLRGVQAGGAAPAGAPQQQPPAAQADGVGAPLQTSPQAQQGGAPAPIIYEDLPQQQPNANPGRRRHDAFDPSRNPDAPGAPRALGGGNLPIPAQGAGQGAAVQQPPVAAPRAPASIEDLTTLPPSATPKDEFDLGIGYMQRRDYALAEETLKSFIQRYANNALVGDASYWLGESYYQRKMYREAAEAFLGVTTKFETNGKAPDALLRLGQSLSAMKEKEAACAALGEVTRKYPRASQSVKRSVDAEQKRNKC